MANTDPILKKYSDLYFNAATPIEKNNALNKFFLKVYKKTKLAFVFILDEFDYTQKIFSIGDFQTLRELSYHSEPDITYVTTSRKSISEIEAVDGKISNLHGIFSSLPLGMFSDRDVHSYWERINNISKVPGEVQCYINSLVGHHPYFMDLCCIEYLQSDGISDLQSSSFKIKMAGEFEQFDAILKQDCLLNDAIQLVVGPSFETDFIKVDRLKNFGIIREVSVANKSKLLNITYLLDEAEEKAYVLFGDYFTKIFYNKYLLNTPYWPLWGKTENKLREIINFLLQKCYGIDWQNKIEVENSNDTIWIDNWNKMKQRYLDSQDISSNKAATPVDFAETGQIYYQFIVKYWDWFEQIFLVTEEDKRIAVSQGWQPNAFKCWRSRFIKLIEVRHPIAHNNKGILNAEDIKTAKQYCELILSAIKKWEDNGKIIDFTKRTSLKKGYIYKLNELQENNKIRGKIVGPDRGIGNHNKVKIEGIGFTLQIKDLNESRFHIDEDIFCILKKNSKGHFLATNLQHISE